MNNFAMGPDEAPMAPAADQPASASPELLAFLGQQSEELRASCENIIRKVEEAASLNRDLGAVFGQFDRVRTEFEQTQIELMQAKALLTSEQKSHLATQSSLRNASDQVERKNSEVASLQIENNHLNQTIAGLTADLETVRHELTEEIKVSPLLRQELASERTRLAAAQRNGEALAEEMRRNDAAISALQGEQVAARDRIAVLEREKRSLETAVAEQRQGNAKLNRQLEDIQTELSAAREKIKTLESSLTAEQLEHERIKGLWKEETDARRVEGSMLTGRADGLASRLEATEQLLADARQQLQLKSDNLRHEERKVQEAVLGSNALDLRLQAADAKMTELRDRLQKAEKSNVALVERAQALVKAFKAKELEAEKAQQKLDVATAKLSADTAKFENERDRLKSANLEMSQRIEKLRGEKALLEGALIGARGGARATSALPVVPAAPSRNDNLAEAEAPPAASAQSDEAETPRRQAQGLI